MLKKRRAVGGLISLIGIVLVFGITSVAYLELSSSQTNLINTSINANQKISDRNNERLNFTSISSGASEYTVNVDNLGSETTTIHSQITKNGKTIVGKEEINEKIFAGTDKNITVNLDSASSPGDKIIFITGLGKKCTIPEGVSFRTC